MKQNKNSLDILMLGMCRNIKEDNLVHFIFWYTKPELTAHTMNTIMGHKLKSFHSNDNQKLRTPLLSHFNDLS